MPSVYTHYRFGIAVFNRLPGSIQKAIGENMPFYLLGQHGSDIFSNEKLSSTLIYSSRFANDYEMMTSSFSSSPSKQSACAYRMGLICHSVLENHFRHFLLEYEKVYNLSLPKIEQEYDKKCMKAQGISPLDNSFLDYLKPSMKNTCVIHHFYPEIPAADITSSLEFMNEYPYLRRPKGVLSRYIEMLLLKCKGPGRIIYHLSGRTSPNPECEISNRKLDQLFQEAVWIAANEIRKRMLGCLAS